MSGKGRPLPAAGPLFQFQFFRICAGGGVIADRGFRFGDRGRAPDRVRINERIRVREVRVIDDEGNMLGVMAPFEAMKIARERGLDLVEVSPAAVPPVCKIMDYGRFMYQENKKAHEQRKHQKGIVIKEVKFRPSTAEHDYQVRIRHIIEFLGEGNKVKAMIFHRGREMAHQEVGRAKMERLLKDVAEHAQMEMPPRMEGNVLHVLLAPKKSAGKPAKPVASPASPQA